MSEHHRNLAEIALQKFVVSIPYNYDAQKSIVEAIEAACDSIEKCIGDALGTGERGMALIEVARNAHKAEQKLAAIEKALQ